MKKTKVIIKKSDIAKLIGVDKDKLYIESVEKGTYSRIEMNILLDDDVALDGLNLRDGNSNNPLDKTILMVK